MNCDIREIYWWNGMKKDITDFVTKFLNCQQVKLERQRLGGLYQEMNIYTLKWEEFYM